MMDTQTRTDQRNISVTGREVPGTIKELSIFVGKVALVSFYIGPAIKPDNSQKRWRLIIDAKRANIG